MNSRIPKCLRFAVAALILFAAGTQARAQSFPDRPVRIIVPAAPGGALDLFSRILAQKASEIWRQQVFVDNKPGANWIIGMEAAARSPADGYTLLFIASSGLTINPFAFPNMTIDPMNDLTPVIMPTDTPFVLLANPNFPAKNAKDFLAYLKANPGKMNHGSNSSSTMLISELFKAEAKADFVDVNYRGASQAINDTIGGAIQFCFVDLGSGSTAIDARTLNPIALTSLKRQSQYPDIPTLAESGLPGFAATASTLLLAPSKTPPEILAKLSAVFGQALQSPDVASKFRAMGQDVVGGSPADIRAALTAEAEKWKALISERNIKFQQ